MATADHKVIRVGIQRSGPIFFETSCEGSSATMKVTWNIVLPRLKSMTGQELCSQNLGK